MTTARVIADASVTNGVTPRARSVDALRRRRDFSEFVDEFHGNAEIRTDRFDAGTHVVGEVRRLRMYFDVVEVGATVVNQAGRARILAIMHLVGVRRTLAEQHPWLPGAVLNAFSEAKAVALRQLSDTSATKVTLPFVEERLAEARALMGEDFWPYGLSENRKTLETFLRHHHAQGLSPRPLKPEELFHPGTLESFKL